MDIASIIIHCNSDTIYKFMSDKKKINLWSFGIEWDLNKTEDNISEALKEKTSWGILSYITCKS